MTAFAHIQLSATQDGYAVEGYSCPQCGFSSASYVATCPQCGTSAERRQFGPFGSIWSFTVVRIPIPGYSGDRTLAYVDLDDGPRVLCHLEEDDHSIGRRVRISALSPNGDPLITGVAR